MPVGYPVLDKKDTTLLLCLHMGLLYRRVANVMPPVDQTKSEMREDKLLDIKNSVSLFPRCPRAVSYTHLTLPTNREV